MRATHELGEMSRGEWENRWNPRGDSEMRKLFAEDNFDDIERCITFIALAVAVRKRQPAKKRTLSEVLSSASGRDPSLDENLHLLQECTELIETMKQNIRDSESRAAAADVTARAADADEAVAASIARTADEA